MHVLWACIWLAAGACCGAGPNAASPATRPGLANPAVRKCLDDKYQVEPVVENGVPVDHHCVDPVSGKRCEVWQYFRGECHLPASPR